MLQSLFLNMHLKSNVTGSYCYLDMQYYIYSSTLRLKHFDEDWITVLSLSLSYLISFEIRIPMLSAFASSPQSYHDINERARTL